MVTFALVAGLIFVSNITCFFIGFNRGVKITVKYYENSEKISPGKFICTCSKCGSNNINICEDI